MAIASINPASGELLRTFAPLTETQIVQRLQQAAETFAHYRRLSFDARARLMMRVAELLEAEQDALAQVAVAEMGKPIWAAVTEVRKCAAVCRYYAQNAERFLADVDVKTNTSRSYVHYQPLGAVLAVMPWNFPFWQVFRFAAPALMAGNVGLLKHASNVPQCALAIEDIFRRAGFPAGVFQTLLIGADQVPRVLKDERVKAVTVTGSELAGAAVASLAGRFIKKSVLELGGSDPFIVMPSAELATAVKTAVAARVINNGQSCIAAKRFLIATSVAVEFERRFVEGMAALRVGNPMEETTDIGPLATPEILATLERQVEESIAVGARLLTGGRRLAGPGNFFAPTVLADIPPGAPVASEETFGPVAPLFRVADVTEAIRLANATTFGLGASVWTNDARERERFIDEIETGAVFVNALVASDPRLPFGGVKRSGYGRELGVHGIQEFVNIKTVWLEQ